MSSYKQKQQQQQRQRRQRHETNHHTKELLSPIQKIHRDKVAKAAAKVGELTHLSEQVCEATAATDQKDDDWYNKTGLDQPGLTHYNPFPQVVEEAAALARQKQPEPLSPSARSLSSHSTATSKSQSTRSRSSSHRCRIEPTLVDTYLKKEKKKQKREKKKGGPPVQLERLENLHASRNNLSMLSPIVPSAKFKVMQQQQRRNSAENATTIPAPENLREVRQVTVQKAAEESLTRTKRLASCRKTPDALKITKHCSCAYCVNPSPFQTAYYQQLEKMENHADEDEDVDDASTLENSIVITDKQQHLPIMTPVSEQARLNASQLVQQQMTMITSPPPPPKHPSVITASQKDNDAPPTRVNPTVNPLDPPVSPSSLGDSKEVKNDDVVISFEDEAGWSEVDDDSTPSQRSDEVSSQNNNLIDRLFAEESSDDAHFSHSSHSSSYVSTSKSKTATGRTIDSQPFHDAETSSSDSGVEKDDDDSYSSHSSSLRSKSKTNHSHNPFQESTDGDWTIDSVKSLSKSNPKNIPNQFHESTDGDWTIESVKSNTKTTNSSPFHESTDGDWTIDSLGVTRSSGTSGGGYSQRSSSNEDVKKKRRSGVVPSMVDTTSTSGSSNNNDDDDINGGYAPLPPDPTIVGGGFDVESWQWTNTIRPMEEDEDPSAEVATPIQSGSKTTNRHPHQNESNENESQSDAASNSASTSTSSMESEERRLMEEDELDELNALYDQRDNGGDTDDEEFDENRLYELELFDRYRQGEELTPLEQEDLEFYKARRRHARSLSKEYNRLCKRQDAGEQVDEDRLYFLELVVRYNLGEDLTEDELMDLEEFEEGEESELKNKQQQKKASNNSEREQHQASTIDKGNAEVVKPPPPARENEPIDTAPVVSAAADQEMQQGLLFSPTTSTRSSVLSSDIETTPSSRVSPRMKAKPLLANAQAISNTNPVMTPTSPSRGSAYFSLPSKKTDGDDAQLQKEVLGSPDTLISTKSTSVSNAPVLTPASPSSSHDSSSRSSETSQDPLATTTKQSDTPISPARSTSNKPPVLTPASPSSSHDTSSQDSSGHSSQQSEKLLATPGSGETPVSTKSTSNDAPALTQASRSSEHSSSHSSRQSVELLAPAGSSDTLLSGISSNGEPLLAPTSPSHDSSDSSASTVDGEAQLKEKSQATIVNTEQLLSSSFVKTGLTATYPSSSSSDDSSQSSSEQSEIITDGEVHVQEDLDTSLEPEKEDESPNFQATENAELHQSGLMQDWSNSRELSLKSPTEGDDDSLSSNEIDELDDLLSRRTHGKDIDEQRLYDLNLFDKWRNGEQLDNGEKRNLVAFRAQRNKQRGYRREFETLLEKRENGDLIDENRLYVLQLYARHHVGDKLTAEEAEALATFEEPPDTPAALDVTDSSVEDENSESSEGSTDSKEANSDGEEMTGSDSSFSKDERREFETLLLDEENGQFVDDERLACLKSFQRWKEGLILDRPEVGRVREFVASRPQERRLTAEFTVIVGANNLAELRADTIVFFQRLYNRKGSGKHISEEESARLIEFLHNPLEGNVSESSSGTVSSESSQGESSKRTPSLGIALKELSVPTDAADPAISTDDLEQSQASFVFDTSHLREDVEIILQPSTNDPAPIINSRSEPPLKEHLKQESVALAGDPSKKSSSSMSFETEPSKSSHVQKYETVAEAFAAINQKAYQHSPLGQTRRGTNSARARRASRGTNTISAAFLSVTEDSLRKIASERGEAEDPQQNTQVTPISTPKEVDPAPIHCDETDATKENIGPEGESRNSVSPEALQHQSGHDENEKPPEAASASHSDSLTNRGQSDASNENAPVASSNGFSDIKRDWQWHAEQHNGNKPTHENRSDRVENGVADNHEPRGAENHHENDNTPVEDSSDSQEPMVFSQQTSGTETSEISTSKSEQERRPSNPLEVSIEEEEPNSPRRTEPAQRTRTQEKGPKTEKKTMRVVVPLGMHISWRSDPTTSFSDWKVLVLCEQDKVNATYDVHRNVVGWGTRKSELLAREFVDKKPSTAALTVLRLSYIEAQVVPTVLDFMYLNKEENRQVLTAKRACHVYKVAELLEVRKLMSIVEDFFLQNLTGSNMGKFLSHAKRTKATVLVDIVKLKIGELMMKDPSLARLVRPRFLADVLEICHAKASLVSSRGLTYQMADFQTTNSSRMWSQAVVICMMQTPTGVTQPLLLRLTREDYLPAVHGSVALDLVRFGEDLDTLDTLIDRCTRGMIDGWDSLLAVFESPAELIEAAESLPDGLLSSVLLEVQSRGRRIPARLLRYEREKKDGKLRAK